MRWDDDDDARSFDHEGSFYYTSVCAKECPMRRRARALWIGMIVLATVALALAFYKPFPPDRTPEGAYARIAKAISEQRPRDAFDYLEQDAVDACFSIRDQRKAAFDAIEASYPAGSERDARLAEYRDEATSADPPALFVILAERQGSLARLRKDLSGMKSVEVQGDRATVTTARGTRYSFRRRPNGIWGLTFFSAELLAESERSARDLDVVRAAAADYARAKRD